MTVALTVMLAEADEPVPLSEAALEEKFFSLALRVISPVKAEPLLAQLRQLQTLDSVRDLEHLLRAQECPLAAHRLRPEPGTGYSAGLAV